MLYNNVMEHILFLIILLAIKVCFAPEFQFLTGRILVFRYQNGKKRCSQLKLGALEVYSHPVQHMH